MIITGSRQITVFDKDGNFVKHKTLIDSEVERRLNGYIHKETEATDHNKKNKE
jgi:hypothetical protein